MARAYILKLQKSSQLYTIKINIPQKLIEFSFKYFI